MREIRYADEGMDMKKLALTLIGKSWLALLSAVLGAAVGGAVYLAVHTIPESEREYSAMSKLYLDFAADETGETYQEYNGYTWNDLLATDPILDRTMSYLPGTYTREEVAASAKAEILSDLRLLTITVTTHHRESTDEILSAIVNGLEDFGASQKEFIQIEAIQVTDAKPAVADSRLAQAVLLGMAVALAAALLGIMLYYILDDRICVASDLRQVTDAPFLGYCFGESGGKKSKKAKESGREHEIADFLQQDYEQNLSRIKKRGDVAVMALEAGKPLSAQQENTDVVILIPYQKIHAAYLGYALEMLRTQGCKAAGIAIGDAEISFIKRYYFRMGKERPKT